MKLSLHSHAKLTGINLLLWEGRWGGKGRLTPYRQAPRWKWGRSVTNHAEAAGEGWSLPLKPPRSGLRHRPKISGEVDQRPQGLDQPPPQEAEPCGHHGHDKYSEKSDGQAASGAGEREARLCLAEQPCLLMSIHWLDLIGWPMTSCHQFVKQSQARINVKDVSRFTSHSAYGSAPLTPSPGMFSRRTPQRFAG